MTCEGYEQISEILKLYDIIPPEENPTHIPQKSTMSPLYY